MSNKPQPYLIKRAHAQGVCATANTELEAHDLAMTMSRREPGNKFVVYKPIAMFSTDVPSPVKTSFGD